MIDNTFLLRKFQIILSYLLFTKFLFDLTKIMIDCYRSKHCMERFCKDLKEQGTRIINYEKKNYTTNL